VKQETTCETATDRDVDQLANVIADAFEGYPLTEWIVRQDAGRPARRHRYFALYLRHGLEHGEVQCDPERRAAAIWYEPEAWQVGVADLLVRLTQLLRVTGWRAPVPTR
jgi:hypothetical protein